MFSSLWTALSFLLHFAACLCITLEPACKVHVLSNENWQYKRSDLISGLVARIIMYKIGTIQKLTLYTKSPYIRRPYKQNIWFPQRNRYISSRSLFAVSSSLIRQKQKPSRRPILLPLCVSTARLSENFLLRPTETVATVFSLCLSGKSDGAKLAKEGLPFFRGCLT